ncbi:MAG: Hsp33 family molecular chaperone HslO [Myxococcota bacterium]|nr:Hsp33 family molecular chaperone HslO [Myxococcota bacterium]
MSRELAGGWLVRGLAHDKAVRFLAADTRRIVEYARVAHGLSPLASRLVGEAVLAAVFMSAHIKGDERITLQIQSDTPKFGLLCDVGAEGGIRARLTPPIPKHRSGSGIHGMLLAIKSNAHQELYRGVTELRHASLAEALSEHMLSSVQVDVVMHTEVRCHESGEVAMAGGVMVERLPEHARFAHYDHEEFVERFSGLRDRPAGEVLASLAFGDLAGAGVEVLERRALEWCCSCSTERIEAILVALGKEEIQSMLEAEEVVEVTCQFCNLAYPVEHDRLQQLLVGLPGD